MLTTTLAEVREYQGRQYFWPKLLTILDISEEFAIFDKTPLELTRVMDIIGFHEMKSLLDYANPMAARRFAADCAARVLHYFEERFPDDNRPRKAIELARDPMATRKALAAAASGADTAARAAFHDLRHAANSAARAAQWAAAGSSKNAAEKAASAVFSGTRKLSKQERAQDAERKWQEARLRKYLEGKIT